MLVGFILFLYFSLFFLLNISVDIIQGKLDQSSRQLEVDYAIGRDIRAGDVGKISATLKEWCESCETVLHCIEEQIDRANSNKTVVLRHKEDMEKEVRVVWVAGNILRLTYIFLSAQISNLKKTLKTQLTDPDEAMSSDVRGDPSQSLLSNDARKKSIKLKASKATPGMRA